MKKEKSELDLIKDYTYEIKYWLRTIWDWLKLRVWLHCVESVSPVNCWVWDVYFWEDGGVIIYSTDITDLEYCMEKVRDFITRNFKTSLDNQTTQELFDGKIFKKDSTTKDTI